MERPHTAYTSHVRQILNRQFEQERPHTSMAAFERSVSVVLDKLRTLSRALSVALPSSSRNEHTKIAILWLSEMLGS